MAFPRWRATPAPRRARSSTRSHSSWRNTRNGSRGR
jgi:hypothetical protein